MKTAKALDIRKLVLLALLTAIVIILQFVGAFIKFGPFSISLVLLPIAIGSALIGISAGGWLGLVFGAVVLISGDAGVFLAINPAATIVLVFLKGALAGVASGAVYKLFDKKNETFAAIAAATICPIVNTGIFVIGLYMFFLPTVREWSAATEAANVTAYIFLFMIGANFLLELGANLLLSPAIVRLVQFGQARAVSN